MANFSPTLPRKDRKQFSIRRRNRKRLVRSQENRFAKFEQLEDRWLLAGDFGFAIALGDGASSSGGGAVATDVAGNVYTTGTFRGTVDFDPGPGTFNLSSADAVDIFVLKLDSGGNFVWARRMGGAYHGKEANGIALDGSGNVYTTGTFRGTVDFDPGPGTFNLTSAGGNTDADIFVSKLDSGGNFVWARRMGGMSSDKAYGIAIDASDNVYTTGGFSDTSDFDPGPGTFDLTSTVSRNTFVSKLDSEGNFVWARQMGSFCIDCSEAIAVDASGNDYTTGTFNLTVDFDPGPGTFNLSSAGFEDVFVSKLDNGGNFLWASRMGGDRFDGSEGITLDASGNVYTTGVFVRTADFDPGPGTFNLSPEGDIDAFVSKLDSGGNFVWARQMGGTGHTTSKGIALDVSGNVYTTGSWSARPRKMILPSTSIFWQARVIPTRGIC